MDPRERFNELNEALITALQGWQSGLWTAMPAIVQSFDSNKMTCTAQPAIKAKITTERAFVSAKRPGDAFPWVTLPLLVDVPVMFPGGGGYTLTFPIAQGDEALIVFASRCIDDWWATGKVGLQSELRMHDLSDGFALVGVRSQPRVFEVAESCQLRSDDGETLVDLSPGRIQLTADVVVAHAREVFAFDAGGTGIVFQPGRIDYYTDGVPTFSHPPDPPGPLA